MSASTRVRCAPVEGADRLFTAEFCDYLCKMHDDFTPRVHALRRQRDAVLKRALEQGTLPGPQPASAATTGDWKVPPVPEDLRRPGIEISGPCSITSMFINALNPGPEGERAEGDLDDDEDSAGHRLADTVRARGEYLPDFFPLPHPSPRNRLWLKENAWFEREILPQLRRRVKTCLTG